MCLSKKKDCCDLIFIYISKRKNIYIYLVIIIKWFFILLLVINISICKVDLDKWYGIFVVFI